MQDAALICRVSTREQEIDGYSLEAQEKLLSDYAHKRQLRPKLALSFSETASKTSQRKKFNAFLA